MIRMKKLYLLLPTLMLLWFSSCDSGKATLEPGESMIKSITMRFDSTHLEFDDWVEFEVKVDSGLYASFSKGTYDSANGTFFIYADEYLKDTEPLLVSLTSDKEGTYGLELSVVNSSEGLDLNYDSLDKLVVSDLEFTPKWKIWLPWISVAAMVLIVSLIVVFVRIRQNNSFDYGTLDLNYPQKTSIELAGKSRVNVSKILGVESFDCKVSSELVPKVLNGEVIETKCPLIEVDDDLGLTLTKNGEDTYSSSLILEKDDVFEVLNAQGESELKGKYLNN